MYLGFLYCVIINNVKINWIDAKNFYGANNNLFIKRLKKQTKKYIDGYGTGCIIFRLSFCSTLNFDNILLLDYDSVKQI